MHTQYRGNLDAEVYDLEGFFDEVEAAPLETPLGEVDFDRLSRVPEPITGRQHFRNEIRDGW